LGDNDIGGMVVNRPAQEYNPLTQKARIYVVSPFPELRFFNNGWYKHISIIHLPYKQIKFI